MSKTKEVQMKQWKTLLEVILSAADGNDTVLRARANHLKRAIGDSIDGWLACDQAHSNYLDGMFTVTRNNAVRKEELSITKLS